MAHYPRGPGFSTIDAAKKFFIIVADLQQYFRDCFFKWDRFLDETRYSDLGCYFDGCDHSPENCRYQGLVKFFEVKFGQYILRYAERVVEISEEKEKMDPAWDEETYAAVKMYRMEKNRFDQIRAKRQYAKD